MLKDDIIIIWAALFSFVSTFLLSLIKLILRLKFPTGRRQVEDVGVGAGTIFTFTEYGGQRADVESPPKPRLREASSGLASFLEGRSSLSSVPWLSPLHSLLLPSMLREDHPSTNLGASVSGRKGPGRLPLSRPASGRVEPAAALSPCAPRGSVCPCQTACQTPRQSRPLQIAVLSSP